MKTKLLFTVLVSLFSVSLFSQTTHKFTVTSEFLTPGEHTDSATVQVGDVVEFINGYIVDNFNVKIDGVGQAGYNPSPSVNIGDVIYSYTFQPHDLGTMDILVCSGISQFRFQYIHFTVVNSTDGVDETTVGVDETSDITFSVYPNPTTDFLNISGTNVESVKVFNMNGQLVLSDTFNSSDVKIDVTTLTNGFYTVFVNDSKPIRFIKN